MISFSCGRCGMKFQVKTQFAGRASKCPTCKQALVVPAADKTVAIRAGEVEGTSSSLAQAGVDGGVTLDPGGSAASSKSIRELLAKRPRKGERYIIEGEIARGGMGS